jgi:hypothetical protein
MQNITGSFLIEETRVGYTIVRVLKTKDCFEVVVLQDSNRDLNGRDVFPTATLASAYSLKDELLKAYRSACLEYGPGMLDEMVANSLALAETRHDLPTGEEPKNAAQLERQITGKKPTVKRIK